MGIFDWLKPKPRRLGSQVARELAEAVFALHPAAADRVIITVDARQVVQTMEVPETAPGGSDQPTGDRALQTARVSELIGELSRCGPPVQGPELTVMRDRVIWMPSVITFPPST